MFIQQVNNGVFVLRDDILPGGTKSVLMPHIVTTGDEYVYASPVYGGFQIALAAYCQKVGKRCTIFCAKRKTLHANTERVLAHGAKVEEIAPGYLSVIERRARDYAAANMAVKLDFGAKTDFNIGLLSHRASKVFSMLGQEPDEIWCALGSGTLTQSLLLATETATINAVQVGQKYTCPMPERLKVWEYHLPFDKPSRFNAPFPSMPNYDLKAWEYCCKHSQSANDKTVLFWNVL